MLNSTFPQLPDLIFNFDICFCVLLRLLQKFFIYKDNCNLSFIAKFIEYAVYQFYGMVRFEK